MKKYTSFLMLGIFALTLTACHEKTEEEKAREEMEQAQEAAEAAGKLLNSANDFAKTINSMTNDLKDDSENK